MYSPWDSVPNPAKGLASSGLLCDLYKKNRSPEDVSPLAGFGAEPHKVKNHFHFKKFYFLVNWYFLGYFYEK